MMKALLLTLLAMTTGAICKPAEREARPVSKSLVKLVQDAMRLAVDEANHIHTQCVGAAFVGDDSRKHLSPGEVFASLPCNCLCNVCWKSARDDLIEQCENYCEGSCRWIYRNHDGGSHVTRAATEVCFGLIDRISIDLGGLAKLFREFSFRR